LKKILFTSLNDHVPWGGSEVLWTEVAKKLSDKYQVVALVKKWSDTPNPIQNLEECGVKICYKPIFKSLTFKQQFVEKIKSKFGLQKKEQLNDLEVVYDINSFELVVISLGDYADSKLKTYTEYLRRIKVPYVIIVQLATDLIYLDDIRILQLKEAYVHAKAVCYLSKENLETIELQFGVLLTNTLKIDNPFFYKQIYIAPVEQQVYHVACVAALTTFHKGQELLLKALAQDKWRLRNIRFNFYGIGINEIQLKNLIALYKLDNIVKLKGYESDNNKIWEKNIACIMPSRMEGQSLAMLEAMSFGRMIISTKVGDAERLIRQNETGFLIDAPTVSFIDITLEKAWENRTNWIEMGKLSRKHLYDTIKKDSVIDFSEKLQSLIN
jgi:glycosyltransferase involved in cell wall biosynthesis